MTRRGLMVAALASLIGGNALRFMPAAVPPPPPHCPGYNDILARMDYISGMISRAA